MTASPSKTSSRGARVAAIVVLMLIGLLVFAQGSSGPVPVGNTANPADSAAVDDPDTLTFPGKPPPSDISALLDGLSLGNEFDGWKVVNFNSTNEKILWIEFGKDRMFFSVGVGTKGQGKPPPPIQTEGYEVGFGMIRPKGAPIPPDVMTKLSGEIANRIRKTETSVPKPAAL